MAAKASRPAPKVERKEYHCCYRNHSFTRQKGNFYASSSVLWKEGNGGYFPICRNCMNELLDDYTVQMKGDRAAAMERICLKFDMYWSPEIYQMVVNGKNTTDRLSAYISRLNMVMYHGKTYDDTIEEQAQAAAKAEKERAAAEAEKKKAEAEAEKAKAEAETERLFAAEAEKEPGAAAKKEKAVEVPDEVKRFWGTGYSTADYLELQDRYEKWAEGRGELDVTQQSLIQNIVLAERRMRLDYQTESKNYPQSVTAYNNLLGSANLKPVQNQKNALLEQQTFGTLIGAWEQTKPIPEPEDEFRDCDGIRDMISTWYYGHMASVMDVSGAYCDKYEKAMDKYRVQRGLTDESTEAAFNRMIDEDGEDNGGTDE